MKKILVKGAGVAGLTTAYQLLLQGIPAQNIWVSAPDPHSQNCASWCAGGMLAPFCEAEISGSSILSPGTAAIQWWSDLLPEEITHHGTLVVAMDRDHVDLDRFAAHTTEYRMLDANQIALLEPDLSERFQRALFYPKEAHFDPRSLLKTLKDRLHKANICFITPDHVNETLYDSIIDTTGAAYLPHDPALRGIRGEMLLLKIKDIHFSRPIRLLHPRIPLYIVPRSDHVFMVGATMIESDNQSPITVRSIMELLNAAYCIHPAFAEAELVETCVGIRPAYKENWPKIKQEGNLISLNGFYRHGYLLAPSMSLQAALAALE